MCAVLPDEAQVAEDDVLDLGLEERLAVGERLGRLLVQEVEDDREVVDAEAPERVLVAAYRAEVHAVAVDVEDLARLARVDGSFSFATPRVVEKEVPGHEHEAALLRERDELLGVVRAEGHRLLDEDVLAGGEGLAQARSACVGTSVATTTASTLSSSEILEVVVALAAG